MSDNLKLFIGFIVFVLVLGLVGKMEMDTEKQHQRYVKQEACMSYGIGC